MTTSARSIVFLLLCSILPIAAEASEYLLFTPQPLEGEILMPERGKGVLVKRITIQRGDTLSQLSREFNGKGSYFPQILLFNNIKNPDLIYAGKELMVPVSRQTTVSKNSIPQEESPQPVRQKPATKPAQVKQPTAATVVPVETGRRTFADKPLATKQAPAGKQDSHQVELDSYSQALNTYNRGEYEQALTLFSRFLERYPSSPMAADASLYKAESLLKLSGQ